MFEILKANKKLMAIHIVAAAVFLATVLFSALFIGYLNSKVNYLENDLNSCLETKQILQ